MSAIIRFEDLSYSYPLREIPALHHFSLDIAAGEMLLVVGESGAGKSTFLRAINGLVPHFYGGCMSGRVFINGLDSREVEPRDLSAQVGFVFQDPEAQFVVDVVEDELVFAMENFGLPPKTMHQRVERLLHQLDISQLRHRRISTLSGGEKQRVAIASVLTLHPEILVLDEPTSQLDPTAAEEVLVLLERLNREMGLTIIIAEHRLERVVQHVDRVLWLPGNGAPPLVGPPRTVLREIPLAPPIVELGRRLGWEPTPLTIAEGKSFTREMQIDQRVEPEPALSATSPPAIEVEQLSFAYGDHPVLHDLSFQVQEGEFVAIMGRNGSGKSTLARHLIGLLRPQSGSVRVAGAELAGQDVQEIARKVGYVPQDPNALLFAETVYEELLVTLRNHGLDPAQAPLSPDRLLARLGLDRVANQYPRDLSAGQRERVALGAVLVTHPPIILLDEPTRGLDYLQKRSLMEQLTQWQREGSTVLLISHDVELVASYAGRVILLVDGRIALDGTPREVLSRPPFAPQMARLFERPDLLTVEDVIEGLAA